MMIYLFFLFFIFALYAESLSNKKKNLLLLITCIVLALGAGLRNVNVWPDNDAYIISFVDFTPSLFDYRIGDVPNGYSEMGFFFIGVLTKIFSNSYVVYFVVVSALTFLFLYYDFKKYTVYPFLGICAYLARFFIGRNLIQIRSGLAYAIVLLGVQYIAKKDWKRYFALVFIAYMFHRSAIIAIPLYFISLVNIKKWHVVFFLIVAFIIGGFFSDILQTYIVDSSQDMDIATTYTQGSYVEEALGLANPMIYFQTFILLAFTFNEGRLHKVVPYYYYIRIAYLYSTFILIAFSMFTALSGRTSTMFATFEFAIIPSLAYMFSKKNRWLAFMLMGGVLTIIMYMNIAGRA